MHMMTPPMRPPMYDTASARIVYQRRTKGRPRSRSCTFVCLPRSHHHSVSPKAIGDLNHFRGNIALLLEIDEGLCTASFRESLFRVS